MGLVQGVGFRPFVYRLASSLDLAGWVRNNCQGVQIEIEGSPDRLDEFVDRLVKDKPPRARIDEWKKTDEAKQIRKSYQQNV